MKPSVVYKYLEKALKKIKATDEVDINILTYKQIIRLKVFKPNERYPDTHLFWIDDLSDDVIPFRREHIPKSELDDYIREMLRAGLMPKVIYSQLGISSTRVQRVLRDLDIISAPQRVVS